MVEFRLYYDETGKVICYTCEDLPGDNYIVIDSQTYAECNPDIRIIDKQIHRTSDFMVMSRLVESNKGVKCDPIDICILSDNEDSKFWEVEINEFRKS